MASTAPAQAAHAVFDGYTEGTDEERPLAAYGTILGTFAALVSGGALLARGGRGALPSTLGLRDVALLGAATYKIGRLLTRDTVTSPLRAPFTRFTGPGSGGEVDEEPRGHGLHKAVGELVSCPYCMGQWVVAALGAGLVFAPTATRFVAALYSALALADFLQFARAEAERREK